MSSISAPVAAALFPIAAAPALAAAAAAENTETFCPAFSMESPTFSNFSFSCSILIFLTFSSCSAAFALCVSTRASSNCNFA